MSTHVYVNTAELKAEDLVNFCTILQAEGMQPFVTIGDRNFLIKAAQAVENDVVLYLHNPKTKNTFAVEVSILTAENVRRHYEEAVTSQTFGHPPSLCHH